MTPASEILTVAGLSQGELARRMRIPRSSVSAAGARGDGVSVEWLRRAAEAAGVRLDIRVRRGRTSAIAGQK